MTDFLSKSSKKATITISQDDFKAGIMKMVAYDAVSLTFFKGEGFQSINGDLAKSLGVALGRDAVRDMVLRKVAEEKKKLGESIAGSLGKYHDQLDNE
jgi:hypothetical protein